MFDVMWHNTILRTLSPLYKQMHVIKWPKIEASCNRSGVHLLNPVHRFVRSKPRGRGMPSSCLENKVIVYHLDRQLPTWPDQMMCLVRTNPFYSKSLLYGSLEKLGSWHNLKTLQTFVGTWRQNTPQLGYSFRTWLTGDLKHGPPMTPDACWLACPLHRQHLLVDRSYSRLGVDKHLGLDTIWKLYRHSLEHEGGMLHSWGIHSGPDWLVI